MLILFLLAAIAHGTLVSVVITFRHGGRAPAYKYTWDTGKWPQGLGELTPAGMRQHYLNGREFRHKYITLNALLDPALTDVQVHAYSTDFNRTLQSCESMLSGLFGYGPNLKNQAMANLAVPPFGISNLDDIKKKLGLNALPNRFQSIPIHSAKVNYDYILRANTPECCPRMGQIAEEEANTPYYQSILADYENGLQKEIMQVFGVNVSYSDAGWMGDTITSELFHGFPMPDGVSEEMYHQLRDAYNISSTYSYVGEGAQLSGSTFFKTVINQFNASIADPNGIKLGLYSSHDSTTASLLAFLNLFDGFNPVFATTLIFELHQQGNDYFVQIIYNDEILTLGGCVEMCPFTTFREIIEPNIFPNITEACQLKPTAA